MQAQPGVAKCVGVLDAVLLVVHDHQIGCEPDDRLDVRVLRAADSRQVGLLAEPRARHRVHADGAQRLGDGRDERDDAQSRGYIRSRSAAFLISNSSAVMWPLSRRAASCSICSGMLAPPPGGACGADQLACSRALTSIWRYISCCTPSG